MQRDRVASFRRDLSFDETQLRVPRRNAVGDQGTDPARPVVVDNRPGATGRIAVDALKGVAPDGSTILLAPIALPVIVPLVFRNAHFDAVRDLAPIAQVTTFEYALAVATDHPAQSLREFVAWAKVSGVHATYGTPASESIPHFLGAMLASTAAVDLLHIPYKGAPQLETDLIGGRDGIGDQRGLGAGPLGNHGDRHPLLAPEDRGDRLQGR